MNLSGIYQIQSKIKSNRIYIGSAINMGRRWHSHLNQLRKGNHHSRQLQRHYLKYGESDLQFSILLGCEKEDLLKCEQYFIDSYQPYFNTCKIAGSMLGFKFTVEAKKEMSNRMMGHIPWNKGGKGLLSKEAIDSISKTLTGKKQSQETINKRVEKVKRTWELKRIRNEHHPKKPAWNKGKHGLLSEISLQKIRDARSKQVFTQESQNKKSISMKKTLALKRLNLTLN